MTVTATEPLDGTVYVGVHAEHPDPASGQLDGHPAGAATAVQHRGRPVPADQVGLAVRVHAGLGHPPPPLVVAGQRDLVAPAVPVRRQLAGTALRHRGQ